MSNSKAGIILTKIYSKLVDVYNALPPGGFGVQKDITAAGTNQATAQTITKYMNRIDTVAAGTGVKASVSATIGFRQIVQNNGANDLVYYPYSGNNFYTIGVGASAANAGVTIAPGNQVSVVCYSTGELTFI